MTRYVPTFRPQHMMAEGSPNGKESDDFKTAIAPSKAVQKSKHLVERASQTSSDESETATAAPTVAGKAIEKPLSRKEIRATSYRRTFKLDEVIGLVEKDKARSSKKIVTEGLKSDPPKERKNKEPTSIARELTVLESKVIPSGYITLISKPSAAPLVEKEYEKLSPLYYKTTAKSKTGAFSKSDDKDQNYPMVKLPTVGSPHYEPINVVHTTETKNPSTKGGGQTKIASIGEQHQLQQVNEKGVNKAARTSQKGAIKSQKSVKSPKSASEKLKDNQYVTESEKDRSITLKKAKKEAHDETKSRICIVIVIVVLLAIVVAVIIIVAVFFAGEE